MVDSGIILLKYWLEVSPDEQTRRLESRIDDPRKIWKLSDMDLKSYSRWYDYSRARDDDVRRHRHRVGALVRRAHRRQEARPAQHHQPPAQPGPLRAARARATSRCRKRQKAGRLPGARTCRCATSRRRSERGRLPRRASGGTGVGPGGGHVGAALLGDARAEAAAPDGDELAGDERLAVPERGRALEQRAGTNEKTSPT